MVREQKMRYETDPEIDLEKKLDLDPDIEGYLRDLHGLNMIREGEIQDGEEAYSALTPNTYHEMFSDPRLKEDEVLKVDEEQVEEFQQILDENKPESAIRPVSYPFRIGYNNSGSKLIEDPAGGLPVMEEAVQSRRDPFSDAKYVKKDEDVFMEKVPGLGEFSRGKMKASSDRYYNLAAPRVRQEIGDVDLEVK
ncbi:MAG: hypothetical protein ABEK04_03240 [Candidatus Nanohalobium sp.]